MPAEVAGVGVECHQGGAIQVVAFPALAMIVRTRIAGSIEKEVLFRIVSAGHPDAHAADLP